MCEHTRNSIKYALKDSDEADLKVIQFEDILNNHRKSLKEICDFIEVDFEKDMVPQPDHEVCFGSTDKDEWYPLRTDVNQKYYDTMSEEDVEFIHEQLGEYAKKFNYSKPELI